MPHELIYQGYEIDDITGNQTTILETAKSLKTKEKLSKIEGIKVTYLADDEFHDKGEDYIMPLSEARKEVEGGFAEFVQSPEEAIEENERVEIELEENFQKATKEIAEKVKVTKKELELSNLKNVLKEESKLQEIENYKEGCINWLEGDFWDSWDKIKGHAKNLWKHKQIYEEEEWKKFFLAHNKDTIKGKPQLIQNTIARIPLVKQAIKKMKDEETGEEIEIQSFYILDERFDKRHDGFEREVFALDFYLYKIITPENKEYFALSEVELPNQVCSFSGMEVPLDDLTDMSRNLKIKSISRLFFVKDFVPDIRILTKEQIITYTKERAITANDWINFLNFHPQGTWNVFPETTNLTRSSFILSGKVDGYPMHILKIGVPGTKKSMGEIETLAFKFAENFPIFEGGNSRVKGLTPSFKEKPCNLGYLIKCERIGFVDELGKMVEFELNKHDTQSKNILGEINFILEHKNRLVGSGNDNDIKCKGDSKYLLVSNPINAKPTIAEHIGILDPTTMSRTLVLVQDDEETNFLLSPKAISEVPPTPTQAHPLTELNDNSSINIKKSIVLKMCWGKVCNREEFLTLFDTCNSFVSDIEEDKVDLLTNTITMLAREPMKSSVWKPRGLHHVKLLIDGLCKHRCLFEDYDSSFIANKIDYDRVEKILLRMVKAWDTYLSPKEEFND
jgi:hypothetical protein